MSDEFESDEFESPLAASDEFEASEESEDAKPARGRIVSKLECAVIFGISRQTMNNWIKEGCPVVNRGGRGAAFQVDTAEVFKWKLQREGAEIDAVNQKAGNANARIKEATARSKELANAQAEGRVIEKERGSAFLKRVFGDVRSSLLSLETQITGLDEAQRFALNAAVREALRELTDENADHDWSGTNAAHKD